MLAGNVRGRLDDLVFRDGRRRRDARGPLGHEILQRVDERLLAWRYPPKAGVYKPG